MSGNREKVRQVLIDLVTRKDPTMFQDAETFERVLRTQTGIQGCAEISALKAGLEARIPWNLWEGAPKPTIDRNANPAILQKRSQELLRKFLLAEDLAVWAVETWALAVGLVLPQGNPQVSGKPQSAPVARPASPPGQAPTPAARPAVQPTAPSASTPASTSAEASSTPSPAAVTPVRVDPTSRYGLIYGLDDRGCIRVFQVWWKTIPPAEAGNLTAIPAKPEPVSQQRLFSAAPARSKQRGATPAKPHSQPVGSSASPSPTAATKSPPSKGEELYQQAMAKLTGVGCKRDLKAAQQLFQESVAEKYLPAAHKLGELSLKGDVALNLKADPKVAAQWFNWAAEKGYAESQVQLGTMYQCGLGVDLNLSQARKWLQKAAEQGHPEAVKLLNTIGRA